MKNNNLKQTKNQRVCVCGEIIPRDELIFNNAEMCGDCRRKISALTPVVEAAVTTPHRIIRCVPCRWCKKGYAPQKLVSDLKVCHRCIESVRTENTPKRNRFIAGIVAKFEATLRHQVFAGGQR